MKGKSQKPAAEEGKPKDVSNPIENGDAKEE
jgi:hypothetical protein